MPAPLPPVDPNVKLPGKVISAGQAADALHARAYSEPASPQQPDQASSPTPDAAPAPSPAPQPAPPPAQPPEPQPQQPAAPAQVAPQPGDKTPPVESADAAEWRRRYMSMEGRWKQSTRSMGAMQETLQEMGDELMRVQDALAQSQRGRPALPGAQPHLTPPPPAQVELTPEELQAYPPELIAVMQKVARASVMPDLHQVQTSVKQDFSKVAKQVQQFSRTTVVSQLDQEVPEWRALNKTPEFVAWCNLPDVYSGIIRGKLLNEAIAAGHAARAAAIFKGFLSEQGSATSAVPVPLDVPPAPQPPRTPAVNLEHIAAPGRAQPGSGDPSLVPAEKPHFTRDQIRAFYRAVNSGLYVGREKEKAATEAAIFDAQNNGRVH